MKTILTFLILILAWQLNAQRVLHLTSGEDIEYKKHKEYPGYLELKFDDRSEDELKVPIDQVISYTSIRKNGTYFKVPDTGIGTTILGASLPYEFLGRIVTGEINVYIKFVTTTTYNQYGPMTTTTTYLFMEKDGEMTYVFNSGLKLFSKKDFIRKIESIIEDSPQTHEMFQNGFKLKYDKVIEIAKVYNHNGDLR